MKAQYFHHIPPKSPHFLVCTYVTVHARVVHILDSGGSGGMTGMSDPMASLDQGSASARSPPWLNLSFRKLVP